MKFEQPGSLFSPEQEQLMRASEPVTPEDYVPEVLPSTGEKLAIVVNQEHAFKVIDNIMEAYRTGQPPYNREETRLPQDPRHMPERLNLGGIDHAMFLFNICNYMRGGTGSITAVKCMARVYDEWPELFDCKVAIDADPEDIADVLTRNGLGFQKRVARDLKENSRRLLERYDGDPRKIFDGITSYEESLELVMNDGRGNGFVGFREKMTSMLTYYLVDAGLIEQFDFPAPIDLHFMRVSIANEMISVPDAPYGTNLYTDEVTAALRKLYFDYVVEKQVDPIAVTDAVWMLSESSCGTHPGNSTSEPFGRSRRNGRKTYLIPGVVDPSNPVQRAAYASTCAICPIEKTCEFNIPGTHYYVGGSVIFRCKRMRFPISQSITESTQESLF
ncbi:MAG TPA: hypothetical protein VFK03_04450 [Candidatus Saccharimonadales bacterium]|nr:hypothetical protein [Candidatus Saccharimonadales bacterium]